MVFEKLRIPCLGCRLQSADMSDKINIQILKTGSWKIHQH
jgi:hypothetical protein